MSGGVHRTVQYNTVNTVLSCARVFVVREGMEKTTAPAAVGIIVSQKEEDNECKVKYCVVKCGASKLAESGSSNAT